MGRRCSRSQAIAFHVHVDVAVKVGDVEEALDVVGGDLALFFERAQVVFAVLNGLFMGTVAMVAFVAGESLTRRAFPRQGQLWRLWSPEGGRSREVLGGLRPSLISGAARSCVMLERRPKCVSMRLRLHGRFPSGDHSVPVLPAR